MTQHTITWNPITEERYEDQLGLLPPALHLHDRFLVGEPWSHRGCRVTGKVAPTYRGFICIGERFFECGEDLTVAEFRRVATDDVLASA